MPIIRVIFGSGIETVILTMKCCPRKCSKPKGAFVEDRDILVEVHKGMKNKRTRNINLGIDAGSMRFRKMIEKRIAGSTGSA